MKTDRRAGFVNSRVGRNVFPLAPALSHGERETRASHPSFLAATATTRGDEREEPQADRGVDRHHRAAALGLLDDLRRSEVDAAFRAALPPR